MEDLTKHQVILLSLLLSFVTSIGTGVITFSLLSEAPVGVTQTINRVVEKTIERIVPSESLANVREVTVKETVVVKEEDLVIDAIEKNANHIVEIRGLVSPEVESSFYGLGFVVTKEGLIVAPANIVVEGVSYSAKFSDNQTLQLSKPELSEDKKFAFFVPGSTLTTRQAFSAVNFGNSNDLKLGQSAIVLAGKEARSITQGRIVALLKLPHSTTTIVKINDDDVVGVELDALFKERTKGELVLNLSGEMIGFGSGDENSLKFIPSNYLKKEIDTYIKKPLSTSS